MLRDAAFIAMELTDDKIDREGPDGVVVLIHPAPSHQFRSQVEMD